MSRCYVIVGYSLCMCMGAMAGGLPSGEGCPDECCNRHPNPGCNDPVCEAAVCDAQPLCCQVEWDLECQNLAFDLCGLEQRSDCCGFIGAGQVCSDAACVEVVCAADPFCCETS